MSFPAPQYRVQVYSFLPSTYGPGTMLAEFLYPKNIGYSDYLNDVPESFFTLDQDDPQLPLVTGYEGKAHCFILRDNVVVWAGWFGMEHDSNERDVIFTNYGYLAGLYTLCSDWNVQYAGATVGTIVSDGWTRAKTGIAGSPLNFVTTGTIESPVTTSGGVTALVLPRYAMYYKRLLFMMREMAALSASDTTNNVVFEITHSMTPSFNFWKARTTNRPNVVWEYGDEFVSGFRDYSMPIYRRNNILSVGNAPNNAVLRYEWRANGDYRTNCMALAPSGYWRLGDHPANQTGSTPDTPLSWFGESTNKASRGDYKNVVWPDVTAQGSDPLLAMDPNSKSFKLTAASSMWGQVPASPDVLDATTKVTVNCWFKINATPAGDMKLFSHRGIAATPAPYTTGYEMYVTNTTGRLSGFAGDGTTYYFDSTTGPNVCDGKPHMGTVTIDTTGNLIVYVDGAAVYTVDVSAVGSMSTGALNAYIGAHFLPAGGAYWNGWIQEMAVWNGTILTPTQIATLYTVGSQGAELSSYGTRQEPIYFQYARDQTELVRVTSLRGQQALRVNPDVSLRFTPNSIVPPGGTGWGFRMSDTVKVKISRGATSINSTFMVTGYKVLVLSGNENLRVQLQQPAGV